MGKCILCLLGIKDISGDSVDVVFEGQTADVCDVAEVVMGLGTYNHHI